MGEALTTMRASPLRSLLSVSGVLVGFTTLSAILAYAGGFESLMLREEARARDVGLIVVSPTMTEVVDGLVLPPTQVMRLGDSHLDSVAALVGDGAVTALRVDTILRVDVEGASSQRPMQVRRVSRRYFEVVPAVPVAGRLASDGAVVNEAAVTRLGLTPSAVIGREVQFRDVVLPIAGVVADGRPGEPSIVIVPLADRRALDVLSQPATLLIRLSDTTAVAATLRNVQRWIEGTFWPRAATVSSVGPSYARSLGQFRIAKVGIGALAGIAIASGVIGIMNIMFAAVLERTREIGIRRACGARRRDIQRQFLVESIAIALIGATVGILLGVGVAALIIFLARRAIDGAPPFDALLAPLVVVGLLAAATLAGALAGWYPASRAARLAPAEAIRVE